MRKIIGCAALVAALCASPASLAFAQGTAGASAGAGSGTTGAVGTGAVGTASPAPGTSLGGNTIAPYANTPTGNAGMLPSGIGTRGTQPSIAGTSNGRLNGTATGAGTNTPSAAAGGACGLSLTDPTSGSLTPLTPPLSPGSAAGG